MRRLLIVGGCVAAMVVVSSAVLVVDRVGRGTPRSLTPTTEPPSPAQRPTPHVITGAQPIRVYVVEPLPPPTASVALKAGTNEVVYTGPTQPLGRLLFPLAEAFTEVTLRTANGREVTVSPGFRDGERTIVFPGSVLSIVMTEAASLAW